MFSLHRIQYIVHFYCYFRWNRVLNFALKSFTSYLVLTLYMCADLKEYFDNDLNKMNCELMLTYDTPVLRQTRSRNLTGQKTLPTIWGAYMKLVTKYQISVINRCWEKCDEKWAYMFNVYKNQQSRQTGSRNLMGPKTLPTIWGAYMKLVTKYQISAINSYWEKCDEKCAYMFNVYRNQPSRQTGSRNLTGPKTLPTIWYTYMMLVTKYQISAINSYWEKCEKNILDGRKDGQMDRGKTVYPPPPSGSGGITIWLKNYILNMLRLQ
jgi:hypothetical protein